MSKVQLCGHVKVWVNNILMFEDKNTIGTFLLEYLASRLNSDTNSTRFLGGHLGFYSTGVIGGGVTNDEGWVVVNGAGTGDGIIISADLTPSAVHYGIDTVVHPTDPYGNYYAQWQGSMVAGTLWVALPTPAIAEIAIGNKFNAAAADGGGDVWASKVGLGPFNLTDTDILTIDWKLIIQ
jgi:hypothetical protein